MIEDYSMMPVTFLILQGNPGLLSEFFVLPLTDGCFAIESVVHRGTLIAMAETGKAKPINVHCEQTKFNVYVKVSFYVYF